MNCLFLGYTQAEQVRKFMLNLQERHLEIIGGVGNPYSIPKGGFVGGEKCIGMD